MNISTQHGFDSLSPILLKLNKRFLVTDRGYTQMVDQLFLTIDIVTHRTALRMKSLRFGKKLIVFLMKDSFFVQSNLRAETLLNNRDVNT